MGGLAVVIILSGFFQGAEGSICTSSGGKSHYEHFTVPCPAVGGWTVVSFKFKMPASSELTTATQVTWGVKYQVGLSVDQGDSWGSCKSCATFVPSDCKGFFKPDAEVCQSYFCDWEAGEQYIRYSVSTNQEPSSEGTELIVIKNDANDKCTDIQVLASLDDIFAEKHTAPSECTETFKVWCDSAGGGYGAAAPDGEADSGQLQTAFAGPLLMLLAFLH
mmetsp:Transcript_61090/g.108639  ORF Transcript_61090/g.108639 Transcript_61090/m.108639 type:complete len:219 (+) Transcript_61090:72-728(+)